MAHFQKGGLHTSQPNKAWMAPLSWSRRPGPGDTSTDVPQLPACSACVLHPWCLSCQILPHSCPNPPSAVLAAAARGICDPRLRSALWQSMVHPLGRVAVPLPWMLQGPSIGGHSPRLLHHYLCFNKAMFMARVRCEYFYSCANSHS